jgi:hypothetical protein
MIHEAESTTEFPRRMAQARAEAIAEKTGAMVRPRPDRID